MNIVGQRFFSGVSLIFGIGLVTGCGGGGGHYHGGGGVPHTSSNYAYAESIGINGQLNEPDAISLDTKGNIYVASYASTGTPKITKFTSSGAYVLDYGNSGTASTGLLEGPQGIYVDAAGNSYVSDANTGQIVVYNSFYKFKTNLLAGQVGTYPYQITSNSSGDLFVASSDLGDILKFNAVGTLLATYGKTGSFNGILSDPDGVATDGAGNIYVADYGNSDLVEYSSSGAYIKTFGNSGTYSVRGPQGITFNATYGIFVADITNSYVYHYDTNGNFIETIGDSSGPGALLHPYDVAVASDGSLLVVDSGNNRVVKYTLSLAQAKKAKV